MGEDGSRSSDGNHRTTHDREIMRTALSGMTVDQLRELRSTIIRLKHLPFTKLVETLFTQQTVQNSDEVEAPPQIYRDDHAFVRDSGGHYESKATRELCEDVEMILRERNGATN